MLKKIIVLLLLLSTLIAACSSSATESPAESTAGPLVETESAAETGTALPTLPTASPTREADQSEAVTGSSTVNCTVVSQQPTPGPTEQSLVPPVSDEDWTLGPEDAAVTFIEYGDFQ